MTETRKPRTEAVIVNGHDHYVAGGAVRQNGGVLKLYACTACGQEVVWAESKRTGRKYLVNVSTNYNGARFYRGDNIHKCTQEATR